MTHAQAFPLLDDCRALGRLYAASIMRAVIMLDLGPQQIEALIADHLRGARECLREYDPDAAIADIETLVAVIHHSLCVEGNRLAALQPVTIGHA